MIPENPSLILENPSLEPITVAEATALRDTMRSLLKAISRTDEAVLELSKQVSSLASRVEDHEETSRQLKSVIERVATLEASLKEVAVS